MARTAVPVTEILLAGTPFPATDGAAGDVVNGNVCPNNGRTTFVVVTNTSGVTPYNVTFQTPGTVGQEQHAIADKIKLMAANAKEAFGPFPQETYGQNLWIDCANVSLKLMVFTI